jgi:hypothetical protein
MQRPAFIVAHVQGGKKMSETTLSVTTPPRTPYFVWMKTVQKKLRQPSKTTATFVECTECNFAVGPHVSGCTTCGNPFEWVDTYMRPSNGRCAVVHDAHTTVKATVSAQVTGLVELVDYSPGGMEHGKTRNIASLALEQTVSA